MMNRFCVAVFLVAALSGCAALSPDEQDKLVIEHAGATGVSVERTGVLFGSIGFVPRDLSVGAVSMHLRQVDGKGRRFEIFATNKTQHANWRAPDVDTDGQRIWAYSARLPQGRYEITLFGVGGTDARDVHWVHFKPAIPVTVTASGAVYVGRWQVTPATVAPQEPQLRISGSDLVLRDMPEEDQLLLVRRRGTSPIGDLPIDDVLRNMQDPSRI